MDEQPVPRDDRWPWVTPLWSFQRSRAKTFGAVPVVHGVREYCVQCGEMIFADSIACVVTLEHGRQLLRLHFHGACYAEWERTERQEGELISGA